VLDTRSAGEIAGAYSLGARAVLTGPVARGQQGQVWRLEATRGTVAVKELFVMQTELEARADADFQDTVRASGVPMPGVVRADGGDVLADLGSAWVRVYEWVDLLAPDLDLDPAAVGRVVAAIHRVRVPAAGPVHPWHTDAVGADRWEELAQELDASGAPFAGDLAKLREEIVAVEELLEPPRELQTCHCDLWADNVVGTPSGGVCVIDWENCGPADARQELAMVLSEFGYGNARRARALYHAYVDAGGPARVDRPGNFSMAIAQLGHIAEVDCERWLDPASSQLDRERAVSRFAELTNRPLTRAVIDHLLAAIGD
jgi:Ser/Thr protein kinase RdoA (MazF antagonist)